MPGLVKDDTEAAFRVLLEFREGSLRALCASVRVLGRLSEALNPKPLNPKLMNPNLILGLFGALVVWALQQVLGGSWQGVHGFA